MTKTKYYVKLFLKPNYPIDDQRNFTTTLSTTYHLIQSQTKLILIHRLHDSPENKLLMQKFNIACDQELYTTKYR